MNMENIKTNIVNLDKLYRDTNKEWIKKFDKNGKLDAHEAFKKR